jgi:hypothetical protein
MRLANFEDGVLVTATDLGLMDALLLEDFIVLELHEQCLSVFLISMPKAVTDKSNPSVIVQWYLMMDLVSKGVVRFSEIL